MPADPVLVGVVHLLPLPGSPRGSPGATAVLDRALADAEAMARGGLRWCIVENIGDAPFAAERVDPHVPAFLAVAGDRIRRALGDALAVGLNALRNDARAALGAAAASAARLVRVNVWTGAAWTDQGLVQGRAHEWLRYRRELGLVPRAPLDPGGVTVAADVLVKHARPAGEEDIAVVARETAIRGGADVLVVTGRGTGEPTDPADLDRVREAVPGVPTWVGSGVDPVALRALRGRADGAIVGTWLHRDGRIGEPVEVDRVRRLVEAARG